MSVGGTVPLQEAVILPSVAFEPLLCTSGVKVFELKCQIVKHQQVFVPFLLNK
jgi:hypothetical protein